jgi:hypothetical protein
MKEVSIVSYCDGEVHGEDARVVAAIEREISIDGTGPVTLDLCNECDLLIQQVQHLMGRGARVQAPSAKKKAAAPSAAHRSRGGAPPSSIPFNGPHICPECKFVSKSREALGQHTRSKHNKGLKDYALPQAS